MNHIVADTILEHARIVDVLSGEIREGSVALSQGRILGISTGCSGREVIDVHGAYLLPGLIDAHVHIESSMVTPERFARLVALHGTTTVIADPHEIANVCGIRGLEYMIQASEHAIIDIRYMLPSCVPSMPDEHNGATLKAEDIAPFMGREKILGLGEFMDVQGVLDERPDVLAKIKVAKDHNKVIDGHCPGLRGADLQRYAASGISTDHECTTIEEMYERIAAGMYVMLREGSAAKDLQQLLPGVNFLNMQRCMFCTDDKHAEDIIRDGHIDHHLRRCVSAGMDPIIAVRMASLHPAICYGLSTKGAVAPGFDADLVLVEDLERFSVQDVYVGGKRVVEHARVVEDGPLYAVDTVVDTIHVKPFSERDLEVRLPEGRARVIRMNPGSLYTNHTIQELPCDIRGVPTLHLTEGQFAKVAVCERHRSLGTIGIGIVEGFGIRGGAIATSISHDSHNIIVIGDNDQDMVLAVQDVVQMQGGISVFTQGTCIGRCPLPVAGLMSEDTGEVLSSQISSIRDAAYDRLGVSREYDPIMTLSFLALTVIPELKITDQGLYDGVKGTFVGLAAAVTSHTP